MHRGWVKSWRRELDHPLYSYPLIWHYFNFCITSANIKDKPFMCGDGLITVKRGSFITSLERSAKTTGLSFQNIRTAQSKLQKLFMISKKSTNRFTIISVCNYETYQRQDNEDQQTTNKQLTNNQQTTNKQLTTTKECKELKRTKKNEKKDIASLVTIFEKFWNKYPKRNGRRVGKKQALEYFTKNFDEKTSTELEVCIENYSSYCEKAESYPKDFIRFMKSGDWKEWLQSVDVPARSGHKNGRRGHVTDRSKYDNIFDEEE